MVSGGRRAAIADAVSVGAGCWCVGGWHPAVRRWRRPLCRDGQHIGARVFARSLARAVVSQCEWADVRLQPLRHPPLDALCPRAGASERPGSTSSSRPTPTTGRVRGARPAVGAGP